MNAARAVVLTAGPIAIAAVAMRALRTTAPAALDVQLTQPLAVLTGAGRFGAIELSIFIVALAASTFAYRATPCDSRDPRAASIALVAIAIVVCAWAIPLAFSSDVYAYAAYGEAALRGLDPFARLQLDGTDPLSRAARVQWGATLPACVYGWGFVATAAAVVRAAAPWHGAGQIAALRSLSSLAMLACGAFTFAIVRGNRIERLRSAALVGCNPVALWSAAEGHNDALAIGCALAGCALARRIPQLGAALAAAAGSIKVPAIVGALPAAARGRARVGAFCGAGFAIAATWPVLSHWASPSNAHGGFAPQVSLQAALVTAGTPILGRAAASAVAVLAAVAAAALLAWSARADIAAGRSRGWVRLALAAWLLIPNPYPWYGVWLLPLAAGAPSSREAAAAIWLPVGALLRYYPDAAGVPGPSMELLLSLLALLPYCLLVPARRSAIINGPS